jgi:hypothetical protein
MRPHSVASPPRNPARAAGLVALAVLLSAATRTAVGQQPRPADQEAINQAIERGVQYLKRVQNPSGTWGTAKGKNFGAESGWVVGYTALAGLTLVECGVPTTDPGLKQAAAGVRGVAGQLDSTYEVALAILFLDRMGDRQDKKVIQMLAARLMAGQTGTGGWGYKVPKLSNPDLEGLLAALRKLHRPPPAAAPSPRARPAGLGLCIKSSDDLFVRPPPKAVDEEKARAAAVNSAPPAMRRANVLQNPAALALDEPKDKRGDPAWATTDNSNTHFPMLALWAARRHDVPVERSFALLVRRFRTSQNPAGMWGYDYARGGGGGTPAMTCVALLGLAIGHVTDPDAAVRPEADPKIINAFAALGKHVGNPAGTTDNRPAVKEVGGLYYLWAMERIAVLYDIRKLARKDWYLWGAEILVGHQSGDGSWSEEGGFHGQHPVINTCFALMFLKRANLTPDLARRLTVDAEALTERVSTTISPPPKASDPGPRASESEPRPEPRPEPPPPVEPEPQPVRPAPAPAAPAAEPAGTAAAAAKGPSPWLPVLIGLLLLLAVLVAAYLIYRQKRQEAAAAAARKKKHRRKRPAFEVVEGDG